MPDTDSGRHTADLRRRIAESTRADESTVLDGLLARLPQDEAQQSRIATRARALVLAMRDKGAGEGVEQFLQEYRLGTREGIVLLCLAEALLRIPDADTADRLIRDKLSAADWQTHLGQSDSLLVNASSWALMLTGRVMSLDSPAERRSLADMLGRLVARSGEPVIRSALRAGMRILARQFVMGRTIEEALERAREDEAKGCRHSYDMLGEAAHTAEDAARYYRSYAHAIRAIGAGAGGRPTEAAPGISVKLSALHPRYEFAQRDRVRAELTPRVLALAEIARDAGVGLTIDAEESERLEPSLDIIERVATAPSLRGWDGLGLAIQAYQKRALPLIDWIADLGSRARRRFMVRLVKGAYWDSEIKRAQERGLAGYPVFTRKAATDVSYLAAARALLGHARAVYPCFATHNALTLAAILDYAGGRSDMETQRLHGMGESLYADLVGTVACRIYAPVGGHEDLLPYLVRRLLENGANTSFVNQLASADIEVLLRDPVAAVRRLVHKPHPRIPLPVDLFQPERRNSRGVDLADPIAGAALLEAMRGAESEPAAPLIDGLARPGKPAELASPADRRRIVGSVIAARDSDVADAVAGAAKAFAAWDAVGVERRAVILETASDLLEEDRAGFMALLVREGGKTLPDAVGEIREAVDFLRYYARQAKLQVPPRALPGPTGESNALMLAGRGVFAAISPWNFPLSIFTGQIAAALVTGNAVVAKPAPQTPLVAMRMVRLLHRAGVPASALQLAPGGPDTGRALLADPRIAGTVFTGSTETARGIARALAEKSGPIVPLIAETGGQNALIADSSALPEQLVGDLVTSAFLSAGQRCSAVRVLFLQEDSAPRVLKMLEGAVAELVLGDPLDLATDIGPIIDAAARARLEQHVQAITQAGGHLLCRRDVPPDLAQGVFFGPHVIEIDRLARLTHEVFGPVLHVLRFAAGEIDAVVDAINGTGYGLTLGIHSRIGDTVDRIRSRARVGNIYVNRSTVGAVVGVQPFGGEGLSGTGPKAGGPHYLARFATERVVSVDTTAAGGNASLLTLGEEE